MTNSQKTCKKAKFWKRSKKINYQKIDYNMNNTKKYITTILFVILLLWIMLRDNIKWWFAGGIFLLDFVPTPIYEYKFRLWETSLFWNIYDIGQYLLGYILWSKIYIYSIIWWTIYIWYRLGDRVCKLLNIEEILHQNIIYIAWISAIIINPFFTERMATQPSVRNGILLLIYGTYILAKQDIKQIEIKSIIYIWLARGMAWWAMNHSIFMIILILTGYIWYNMFDKKSIMNSIYISNIVWLINANRLIWWILGSNSVAKSAMSFSQENINAFATRWLGWLWVEISSILGYGFWAEEWQRLVTANSWNPYRYIFGIMIVMIWIYGIYTSIKIAKAKWSQSKSSQNIYLIYISIVMMIITIWLWIWISNHIWWDLINWIYEHIPWYRWLREPHKWIWIYMMIIVPYIVIWFGKLSKKRDYTILLPIFVFLLYGRAPGIINMWWLYKLTDYPKDYTNSRSYILSEPRLATGNYHDMANWLKNAKRVLIPRHSYMWCDWTSNVIAMTSSDFYKPAILKTADNIEIWSLYTNNSNNISDKIDTYIYSWQDNNIMKNLWYSGFVFWKWCADTGNYQWINNTSKFDNIYSWKDVWVYLIK